MEGGREVRRARTLASSPPPPPPPHPPPRAGEPPPSCRPPAPPPPLAGRQTWATTAPCQGREDRGPPQASTRFPHLLPCIYFTPCSLFLFAPLAPHIVLFIEFHPLDIHRTTLSPGGFREGSWEEVSWLLNSGWTRLCEGKHWNLCQDHPTHWASQS